MMILPEHRAVYVSVPKAGTNTMYKWLAERFGGERLLGPFHRNRLPVHYARWHVFTVVRHPYARAVSLWRASSWEGSKYKRFHGWPLARFTAALATGDHEYPYLPMYKPQAEHLLPIGKYLDHILKLEEFPYVLQQLPFAHPLECLPRGVPHENKSGAPPWREVITPNIASDVLRWAEVDFETYGYSAELVVPGPPDPPRPEKQREVA